ncbi:hypothetical protein LIER_42835 [Lithospermum erythrorhizon]|uniref:Uncharacterized protein n=1 Tax=Lithospermum erythrorhizon TaxID=34254 RepID=A0AAV3P4S7_LITER
MSSSSLSSQLPDYLDRRERLTRTLLGVFADAEFFTVDVHIERRGCIYMFTFNNQDDKDIVGINGHYNVNGALLLLANWTPNISLHNFTITAAWNTSRIQTF